MKLASDNNGPVPEQVFEALRVANEGSRKAYGEDGITEEISDIIREKFEAPEAAIYMVATGTAANSLALATITKPWETIFCTPCAHLNEDECNAPEFYTGGSKLTLLDCDDKITPSALERALSGLESRGVHGPQRGPVSLTQATEKGTVYSLAELDAIINVAKSHHLTVHMDGARFANALVSLDCTPADMTWKRGIDVVTLGCSKNGLMAAEVVIFFNPEYSWEFELRRKRGGHLFSKHRYLSAQIKGYFDGELWLKMAQQANQNANYLAAQLKQIDHVHFKYKQDANMMYVQFPRHIHQRAFNAGAYYYLRDGAVLNIGPADELLTARLVCDWSISQTDIDLFIELIKDN